MNISNLIVEVTRKCNMSCSHCLRGGAQNVNLKETHVDTLLKQVDRISNITFTGGEPTLNLPIIRYFLEKAKALNVEIGHFYIVTNGKKITSEFIVLLLELYAYCDEREYCSVQVSNDLYHSEHGSYNDTLLKGLSFYSKRNKRNDATYNLISEGRAKDRYNATDNMEGGEIDCVDTFNEAEINLNAKGEIINGCNWSYISQKHNIICHVSELTEFYNKLPE